MQNTAGNANPAQSEDRNDLYAPIVSSIEHLIEQIQAVKALIELAAAVESVGVDEVSDNVVVLDDVTPPYAMVETALTACNTRLGAALQHLLIAKASGHEAGEPAGFDRRPVRLIGRNGS